jgi:hypothetical protein
MSDIPDIWNRHKIGDKVWFSSPTHKKLPGIISEDRIETVGPKRDTFISTNVSPYITFPNALAISNRRKTFPGENKRLELATLGLEEEYVKMKNEGSKLNDIQKSLLAEIEKSYRSGWYEDYYTERLGFPEKDLERLYKLGLVYKQPSSFYTRESNKKYIVVPTGKSYY